MTTDLPDGVDAVVVDMAAPGTLGSAFDGVGRAYLLTPLMPDQTTLVRNLVAAARKAGVSHLVRQSALGAGASEPPYSLAASHREAEWAVEGSGIDYTHLRRTVFCQNLLNDAETIQTEGLVYSPVARRSRWSMHATSPRSRPLS